MVDMNHGPDRRTVLKSIGGAAGGIGITVAATEDARAMRGHVHREWGEQAAQRVSDNNDGPPDHLVDNIRAAASEPDDGDYDHCCGKGDYFDAIVQGYTHYRNPEDNDGVGDLYAKDRAEKAKDYRTNGSVYTAAEYTGRAIHYIQDLGTLVHTGREYEQARTSDIHHDYEQWVLDNWENTFSDAADYGGYNTIHDPDDIRWFANQVAVDSHKQLNEHWDDIQDRGPYKDATEEATKEQIKDATGVVQGVIDWIWNS
jgi:hypothetical protein